MFAYRLACKLGVVDVDSLMDSLTPEQWMEWKAAAVLDGWFEGYSKTGEVIAAINNNTNRILLQNIAPDQVKQAAKEMQWFSGAEVAKNLTAFEPRKTKRKMNTVKQVEQQIAARYG